MSVSCAAVAIALLVVLGQDGAAPASATPPSKQVPAVSLGAGNFDKLADLVRSYYSESDSGKKQKAEKELDKLMDEAGKLAKNQKFSDPLLAVDDWREILRRGSVLKKPSVVVSSRAEFKVPGEPLPASPLDPTTASPIEGVFDGKLKAFASVPVDYAKTAYPVILALHPMEEEVTAKDKLTKSKVIVEKVKQWATATYSKELLSKAIVLVPIMDVAVRSPDGVAFVRPRWDSLDGEMWAFQALLSYVFENLNYDQKRVFVDGEGAGAVAALTICTQYPGILTGCIARGAVPEKADFDNLVGTPVLLVGKNTQKFYDEWKGKDGFALTLNVEKAKDGQGADATAVKETLDDATFVQWVADHPKNFAPKKISLRADSKLHASSYWIRVFEEDPLLEKLPIVVDAAIDRDKNEITVVTNEKVKSFDVFLNDDMLDLSKEVRIVHRGIGEGAAPERERFKGTVKRDAHSMLDWRHHSPYTNTGEVYVGLQRIELK